MQPYTRAQYEQGEYNRYYRFDVHVFLLRFATSWFFGFMRIIFMTKAINPQNNSNIPLIRVRFDCAIRFLIHNLHCLFIEAITIMIFKQISRFHLVVDIFVG